MKVIIPVSLLLLGLLAIVFPIVTVAFLPAATSAPFPIGAIIFFGPMVIGLVMIGFGIYFSARVMGEK
jgi:hypothetical protein